MRLDASIVRRSVVILGAIAVPWAGCAFWSARRERAEKEALAAEIRAEVAARPPVPDWTTGRVDLTEDYGTALAALPEDLLPLEFLDAMEAPRSWRTIPDAVTRTLEAHAGTLATLEVLLESAPPGFVQQTTKELRIRGGSVREMLAGRGLASVVRGDWSRALRDVRLLRRTADHLLSAPPESGVLARLSPASRAASAEESALDILEEAARNDALPEAAAVDALAIANETWLRGECLAAVRAWIRDVGENFLLGLLGDDPEAFLEEQGLLRERSLFERARRTLGGGSSPEDDATSASGYSGAPPVAGMRRMWAAVKRLREVETRRDGAALPPDGPIDREFLPDPETGWSAWRIYVAPAAVRGHWREEARIPVVRAALAIRVHERRTGAAPASLQELVPSILAEVPVDPWTREPVKYTRKPGGGWVVEAGPPGPERNRRGEILEETGPVRLER